jgi:hypothetical protein
VAPPQGAHKYGGMARRIGDDVFRLRHRRRS